MGARVATLTLLEGRGGVAWPTFNESRGEDGSMRGFDDRRGLTSGCECYEGVDMAEILTSDVDSSAFLEGRGGESRPVGGGFAASGITTPRGG